MRTKAFWEETRSAATERASELREAEDRLLLEVKRCKTHIQYLRKKKGKAHLRAVYLGRREWFEAELSRVRKELKKVQRKVDYCTERVEANTKTLWDRIRSSSLRI